MSAVALVISWLRPFTSRPSDALVTVQVSELQELERLLLEAPRKLKGKGSRGPRQVKGMTSRSKQRKRPDTAYLAFVRNHPCTACGSGRNIEASHHGRKSQKGTGMKAPDDRAIPLCSACHKHDGFHRWGTLLDLTRAETDALVESTIKKLQAEWAAREEAF